MATLAQIQARLKKLQAQAEAILANKAQAAVKQIQALMLKYGLTTADIEAHTAAAKAGAKRGPKPGATRAGKAAVVAKEPAASVKGKLPPKYINHKTGETWSGHARPPAWIAKVKDRSKFLIASGGDATLSARAVAASTAKNAAKKVPMAVDTIAGKGQPKGPQPALYRDAKSGATWSGRGRPPAWLAGVKDRTKFLIGGVATVAPKTGSAGKASKPKAAGKSEAGKKKGAADKVLGKKVAPSGKTIATKSPSAKTALLAASKKASAKKAAAPLAKRTTVKKVVAVKTVGPTERTPAGPEVPFNVSK
jgi:DNA-binding protein H-NS